MPKSTIQFFLAYPSYDPTQNTKDTSDLRNNSWDLIVESKDPTQEA